MGKTVLPLAAWLSTIFGGCTSQQQANCLIEHGSMVGRFRLAMLGDVDSLLQSGQLTAHQRVKRDDGVILDAWYISARDDNGLALEAQAQSKGTVVLLHGLWDSKARFFDLGEVLAKRGYDVILPDNRAHGNSSGQYITWGAKEKVDVAAIVDAMVEKHNISEEVYVVGLSMGGGIAVQYAAYDPRVKGCLAIAPAASARDVLARMFPLSPKETLNASLAEAGRIAGFDPAEASAVTAATKLSCPLIVVHGRMDITVPISHGRAIYQAARTNKAMHEVPLAGHYTIMLTKPETFAGWVDQLRSGQVDQHPSN